MVEFIARLGLTNSATIYAYKYRTIGRSNDRVFINRLWAELRKVNAALMFLNNQSRKTDPLI